MPEGAAQPTALEISRDDSTRGVFAMLMIEWPQIRARARDRDPWRRFFNDVVPDGAVGFADWKTFSTGAAWPIPLWPEHTSITVGWVWAQSTEPLSGHAAGDRVPLGSDPARVIEQRWFHVRESIRVGLSIELLTAPR